MIYKPIIHYNRSVWETLSWNNKQKKYQSAEKKFNNTEEDYLFQRNYISSDFSFGSVLKVDQFDEGNMTILMLSCFEVGSSSLVFGSWVILLWNAF